MVDPRAIVRRSIDWFRTSGVMRPPDGFWGVGERVVLHRGNAAREAIDEGFPFQTRISEDAVVLEARRPDCNFQTAYLFERAAEFLQDPRLREVADNILGFLFHRSSLRDRSTDSAHSDLWLWAHPAPRPSYWTDDMAWVITILHAMARRGRPDLAASAVATARRLLTLVREYFADVVRRGYDHPPSEDVVSGIRMNPHWIGLLTMAFAHAQTADPRADYAGVVHAYYADYALRGPPTFDDASRRAARSHPWSISEYAYLSLAASVCADVFHDEAISRVLETAVRILLSSQSPEGHFPAEHYEAPDSPGLVDLVYTQNWATLGLLHAARVLDSDDCRKAVEMSLQLLEKIQDATPRSWLAGCWRGMYDLSSDRWGGGDLSEGGANSIYTGWTNAPIALAFLFWATEESLFA
jgi:hypothetical protein